MPPGAPQQPEPSQNAGDTETNYYGPDSVFSMYVTHVTKLEDEKDVKNWEGGAKSILVFTGLFSSTVASFIALSYPSLQQDPNLTTHFLLAQIYQQLSNTTTGDPSGAVGQFVQSPYVPPTSVVFINSAWFLSLVLSLTCALMATLLQQWTRTYTQILQQKYAPVHYARIHEFISGGARKFGISKFVEVLPLLLLLSVFLFFAGLVVFAFRGNHTVAHFTVAVVGFCALSYMIFTLMPLFFYDCPYHTPLTPVFRFSAQIISLSFLSVLYYGTKYLHYHFGALSQSVVQYFLVRKKYRVSSLSENIVSRLERSAPPLSVDMCKRMLVRTVHWLSEDRELEQFVAAIPDLCKPGAITLRDNGDTPRTIRDVLAALPGPTNFHPSLPWSVVHLAQRAFINRLPKAVQQRRTRACLMALHYIPGAIRDVLAPFAAEERFFSEILPLLNTPESLEVIDELWDTPNDDVALSVRCAAAVVTAFMIIPPGRMLNSFSTLKIGSLWDDNTGKRFLTKRLGDSADADGVVRPEYQPRSDSGRLQNIGRFLADINIMLRNINTQWWASDNSESIRRERQALFDTRHLEEYRIGRGMFDQRGSQASPAFVSAAQQDLIILTLEILTRDPVTNVTTSEGDAFREAYKEFEGVALTQVLIQAPTQVLPRSQAEDETQARIRALAAESSHMVKWALRPVLRSHLPEAVDYVPVPVPEDVAPAQKPPPEQIEAIPSLPYSTSSSSAWRRDDADGSPV
ncbi:hypothetical protein H4582DRAFT_1539493 [Lactarius indigo]|nr:hypothetical protein H4582DRAFT_1539493 [Lactarius indigo]